MNARLSQEIDSLLNLMQTQINRAISSAINDKVLPEIQNTMGNFFQDKNGIRTGTSSDERPKTKLTKTDSRSACDLRETMETPYNIVQCFLKKIGQNDLSALWYLVSAYLKHFSIIFCND